MQLDLRLLQKMATAKIDKENANSVLVSLNKYGAQFGLEQPHRLAQFLPQLFHESGNFRYDREVWGPTPAQKRYEGRKDLGNTEPGDGKKFAGHTAMQITGRANTKEFRDWCRDNIDPDCPDFLEHPELMNTDPWEGLGPIWYWTTRGLNKYADTNNIEMITKRINGGLNGYVDRLKFYGRVALVLLGYGPEDVRQFQIDQHMEDVDGDIGPQTRSKLHEALVKLTPKLARSDDIKAAPVTEDKPVAVVPKELDKPLTQTKGFWERITNITGLAGIGGLATWLGDWKIIMAVVVGLIVVSVFGLLLQDRIVTAIRKTKEAVEQ